jgi:hypothetical protein
MSLDAIKYRNQVLPTLDMPWLLALVKTAGLIDIECQNLETTQYSPHHVPLFQSVVPMFLIRSMMSNPS